MSSMAGTGCTPNHGDVMIVPHDAAVRQTVI